MFHNHGFKKYISLKIMLLWLWKVIINLCKQASILFLFLTPIFCAWPQYLYLVLNTQETSHFYWHQFWSKNDGENICHWNYFQIPRALSELPANFPGRFSQKGWMAWPISGMACLLGIQNEIQAVWSGIWSHSIINQSIQLDLPWS